MNYWRNSTDVEIETLVGKTITDIKSDDYEVRLITTDGETYIMFHDQDCCENVELEDVIGEFNDLIGSPITMAEEVTQAGNSDWGSATWTFYKLATVKGYVTLRWFGESNGYYSETVDFVLLNKEGE